MRRHLKTGPVKVITIVLGLLAVLLLIGRAVLTESLPNGSSPDAVGADSYGDAADSETDDIRDRVVGDAATAARGTVQGRILFSGETRRSPSGGGDFTDVIVYLNSDQLPDESQIPEPQDVDETQDVAVLDQIDMTFIPHVVAMHTGQVLELRNSDTALHNVNGLAVRNPAFNIALPPRSVQQVKLPRPEFIRIVCNFHARMSAWIAVLPNRFFTRADSEGRFELLNLPTGTHQLTAWQETLYPPHKPQQTSATVRVRPGQVTQVELNFP